MFNLGLSELLVIGCIIVIFIRPKDLPRMFRLAGKFYARLEAQYRELVSVPERILGDIEAESRKLATPTETEAAGESPPAPAEEVYPELSARRDQES